MKKPTMTTFPGSDIVRTISLVTLEAPQMDNPPTGSKNIQGG